MRIGEKGGGEKGLPGAEAEEANGEVAAPPPRCCQSTAKMSCLTPHPPSAGSAAARRAPAQSMLIERGASGRP